MYIGKRSLLLIFLVFVITISSFSQRRKRKKFDIWEGFHISPMIGLNAFYGDLVDKSRTSYSLGVAFEREFTPYLSVRSQINAGRMKGIQLSGNEEFAKFKNIYGDFGVGATFFPLDLTLGYFRQRSFNPYITGLVGINYFNSEEDYAIGRPEYLLRKESGITPNITLGGGLSYWFTPSIKFKIEALANKPFSDYLDVHEYWINESGGRVYSDAQDFYYTLMVGASFTIKDSRWKNEPKYNRKAYLKTRRYNLYIPKKRKKYKPKKR
ncbi:MAG: hypothetical protein JW717_08005 [Marinilabiliaceae bacterium]|nr:hypothetical protein [Marinilabiliaceae bacterium]